MENEMNINLKWKSLDVGAGLEESFWFDRNFTTFLAWKLTNFDEWKCISLLWEINSYNHYFSLPKVYIHGWYSWLFPCVSNFILNLAKHVHAKFQFSSFYPDGFRHIFYHFWRKFQNFSGKLISKFWKIPNLSTQFYT
jgi:hypothetical protein